MGFADGGVDGGVDLPATATEGAVNRLLRGVTLRLEELPLRGLISLRFGLLLPGQAPPEFLGELERLFFVRGFGILHGLAQPGKLGAGQLDCALLPVITGHGSS